MPVPLFDADDIPRPIMAALEPVAALRFPQQGKTSQVAIVESDRATWVVKRADEMPFHEWVEREYRVLQALGSRALPIPLAFVMVARSSARGPVHWLLMSHLPGMTLEERLRQSPPADARRRLLQSFGAMLRRIHATPVPGALASDEAWIERRLRQAAANRAMYPVDGSPELLHELQHTRPRPQPAPETLIHGDYMLDNVLVTGDEVSGVLDWSGGGQGDPRHDLALATQPNDGVFETGDDLDAFYAGYGEPRLSRDDAQFFLDLDEFF